MGGNSNTKERFSRLIFNAFANSDFCDAQAPEVFWAIEEGAYRIKLLPYRYETPRANKEHECVRGCQIKKGDQYFKRSDIGGIKVCAKCMAMILDFHDVEELPPVMYEGWDSENNRPVFAKKYLHDMDPYSSDTE